MTNLYLIRHGEAKSAAQNFIGDGGLSPLGVRQAERLRDRLLATKEIAADIFIASTFPRAQQTAEIISPAIGVPLTFTDDIQEMRPGEAEGMSVEEFRQTFGEPDFEADPYRPISPGGENWPQFMLRMGTALDRILRVHAGKTIVLVCHGGIINGSFLYFFGMGAWTLPSTNFYTRNTSITQWQQFATFRQETRWRLMKYNDAFHLYDIGSSERIPWEKILSSPASDDDKPSTPLQPE